MNLTFHDTELSLQQKVDQLINQQTREWELAEKNYKGLAKAQRRELVFDNRVSVDIQFNPERIYSSAAKVDAKSISERKCFLCLPNLPEQQKGVDFGEDYVVLVNPFPIFPRHLTIPHRQHIDQLIKGRMGDMLDLAKELTDFVVFYNGPKCGASAPDHFHFQAGNKGFMPIEKEYDTLSRVIVKGEDKCRVSTFSNYLRQCLILDGDDKKILCKWFDELYALMNTQLPAEPEPMMNVLVSFDQGRWKIFLFPRKLHRPRQYFEEGAKQILLSPASVDFGGVLITPREEDYKKLSYDDAEDIFKQVTWDEDTFEKLISDFSH